MKWLLFAAAAAQVAQAAAAFAPAALRNGRSGRLFALTDSATTAVPSLEERQARRQKALDARVLGYKMGSTWYDAQGPRDGPPMNHWQQASAERLQRMHAGLISRTALATNGFEPPAARAAMAEEVEARARLLEGRSGKMKPAEHASGTGSWRLRFSGRPGTAAVLLAGLVVEMAVARDSTKDWRGTVFVGLPGAAPVALSFEAEAAGARFAPGELCAGQGADVPEHVLEIARGALGGASDLTYLEDDVRIGRGAGGELEVWERGE